MKANLVSLFCAASLLAGSMPFTGAANTVTAIPTREMGQTVFVNDTPVTPTAYNIAGNNYFKLRDIGKMVGFGVEWNQDTQTVEMSSKRIPSDLDGITDEAAAGAAAKRSTQRFALDGYDINVTAYLIGGSNYVKLRDIAQQINFGVSYDAATESVYIDTDAPYMEEAASVSGCAITRWDSTMTEFNQAMIRCNWDKSKYLTTAKQYAPVITGKADGTVEDVIAALDAMKGAPVEAVSFDNNPVNYFWANELRKALGQEVSGGNNGSETTPPSVNEDTLSAWEQEMVELVNEERRKNGVAELKVAENLMQSAQFWAEHLTEDFRHSSLEELREFETENMRIGLENITGGSRELNNVVKRHMNNFMTSEGHRNSILNSDMEYIGVGYAIGPTGSIYCVQHFGW